MDIGCNPHIEHYCGPVLHKHGYSYFKTLKLLFSKTASCRELHNLLCDNDFFLFALGPSLAGKFRKKGFKLCP